MTKLELERKFKKAGWSITQGANHEKVVSPDGKKTIPIPRHKKRSSPCNLKRSRTFINRHGAKAPFLGGLHEICLPCNF